LVPANTLPFSTHLAWHLKETFFALKQLLLLLLLLLWAYSPPPHTPKPP
jgi:hypothetical protein